jgi:GPH family glycoside/pentoside/hexuronide:cation symporter
MEHSGKLKWTTKLIYGVGDIGNAVVNSAVQFYLLHFYTDGALIGAALAGTALWVAKFWDAFNDPLFGWVSDRTRSRFGKRRVYMIFGALPLAIAVAFLWYVPGGLSDAWTFVWIVGTFVLFDTVWTLTNVPYYALTAELTDDYDERSSLTVFRMVLGVPAYIVGAALTPVLVALFATKRTGYGVTGIAYGVLAAAMLWIAAAGLRERKGVSESRAETPPLRTFVAALKNRPFVRLIVAYFIANTAFALIQKLMVYFLSYQLGMGDQEVFMVMGLMLVFVALFLFPWKLLSNRWSKGPAYAVGLGIGGLAVAATFLLPSGPTAWVYVIAAVAGIGFSAQWVFPWAMVPDVVDHDRLQTGEHRGGMYYGVWGLALKLSEALGFLGSGWVLHLFGYNAEAAAQSARTLFGIRLFFGPVPLIFVALALPLLIWYPITRASHAKMRAQLEASEQPSEIA